jgi:hypothetical protein
VLPDFGVIEFVSKGKPGMNSGKAAEFRYLLPPNENGADGSVGILEAGEWMSPNAMLSTASCLP